VAGRWSIPCPFVILPLPPDESVHDAGPDPQGLRGRRQLAILTDAGLCPDHDVLDIGCGTGRLAYECAGYLVDGSYTGVDVSRPAIDWLRENYASRLPNFHFDHLNVHSDTYQNDAEQTAESVRFPYPDESFDFVCSFAVFMHLLPSAIARYLVETRRVLRPHGRALLTVPIVIDPDLPPFSIGGSGDRTVSVGGGVYATAPGKNYGMAFDRDLIADLIDVAGLHVATFIPHTLGAATEVSLVRHLAAGGDALVLQIEPPDVPASWR
jgi:SAM-dependent methyltransferase